MMTGKEIVAWVGEHAPPHWLGRGTGRGAAEWRWVAAWLLYNVAGWSLPQIGAALGRDHTSVHHGIRRIDNAGPEVAAELHRVASIARGAVVSMERARA